MSRKHLGMKRPIRQFEKALNEMIDFINAVNFLPPRGEGAKAAATDEWKEIINNVIIQLNNIKHAQIKLIYKEDYYD